MIPIKNNNLYLDRYLFDSNFEKFTNPEKRIVKRVSSKLDMAEDVSKYTFYADGLHNQFVKDLVKNMAKSQNNGLYHGRMELFSNSL